MRTPLLRASPRELLGLSSLLLAGGLSACTGTITSAGPDAQQGAGGATSAGPGGASVGGASQAGGASQGGGGPVGPDNQPYEFACDPAAVPQALPLRRLSTRQLRNAISDLVRSVAGSQADPVLAAVAPQLGALLQDNPQGTDKHFGRLTSLDQAIQQQHADANYDLAVALGQALTATPERLTQVVGACATAASDEACLTTFIQTFGQRVLRRPLTAEDVTFYRQPALKVPYEAADYADVAGLLLSAPQVFFAVEHGDETSTLPQAPLSGHELASRLAFHFWQTAPDDQLLADAASGALATDDGYQKAVDRVFSDPRTLQSIRAFYAEWLGNTTLISLDTLVGTPTFDALRGNFTPGPDTRTHYLDEVTDAAAYYTFTKPASFDTFFRSTRSFARTDDLAQIYGVPVWDGTSEPPETTGRAGLITRPAFVATGTVTTRPIMKGVLIRKALLCDLLGDPPANAANTTIPDVSAKSTRDRVDALTGPGTCGATCHAKQINPLGFVTEGFDTLGRPRAVEQLFNDQGQPGGTTPVNTSVNLSVDDRDAQTIADPAAFVEHLATSPKLEACAARVYFRHTFGRAEDPTLDSCSLSNLETSLRAGTDLGSVMRAVALHPSFKTRSFQ